MSADTLITGAAVVTVDDVFTVFDPGWIHVVDDRIVGIGAGDPEPGLVDVADRIVDGNGKVVMPGMTNAHTHLFQTFFRGLADDKSLLDWLKDCIWPGAVHLDYDSARLAAMVGLIENLRSGATSVIDHQYVHIEEGIDDAVCAAANELGIRFMLARGWADQNYLPSLSETAAEVLDRTHRLRENWHGYDNDRIRIELAPLIPWGCSDEAMVATVRQARLWDTGTHIHCAETAIEVEMSLEERGVRHVEWMESLGLLGPDVQLAHSIWLDDTELELIADRGAVVVHCPVSNMYLASGVSRILDMLRLGIPVALASDGPGSNNRQDMFEVLKATVLLQKIHHLDAVALQPEDALKMACKGGSAAFREPSIGSLQVGNLADLIVVDLDSVFSAPVHSVPSALVFCSSPAQVTHVMVGGRLLIDEGELTMLDEQAVLADAAESAAAVFRRAGVTSRLTV